MTRDPRPRIRIVQAPIGEAPLWVREAWIGVELPVLVATPQVFETWGVLTSPKTWISYWWRRLFGPSNKVEGYAVYSAEAIELLGFRQPLAAQWWRQNAPGFTHPRAQFIFDEPACLRL